LANWDVFHGDRLELERGLTTSAVRAALARGELFDDDLVRPAGTTVAWARLADLPALLEIADASGSTNVSDPSHTASAPSVSLTADPGAGPRDLRFDLEDSSPNRALSTPREGTLKTTDWLEVRDGADDVAFPVINDAPAGGTAVEVAPLGPWRWPDDGDDDDREEQDNDFVDREEIVETLGADDLEIVDDETHVGSEGPVAVVARRGNEQNDSSSSFALPVSSGGTLPVDNSSDWDDAGALAEVPEEEEFSLSRSGPMTVEELDLAPMVDVAFQLVLFFMVAAQTVLYKTLEIPKPTTEQAPSAVAQGRSRTLDELKDDYILLEIDASGAMKLDRQPIVADMSNLVERLRSARETTRRKAMLLSADSATPHRNAVLAYDAANEIGLGIVIARPAAPQGPAPRLLPGQPTAAAAKPAPAPAPSSIPN
jgi:biopolymer transport protein ExbD